MKTVFVCAAGINRSHCLVINSKQMWNWDSLPVGVWGNPSVFPTISAWAERIVLVERWWPEHFLPEEHVKKVAWLEMGMDVWGSPVHPNLNALARKLLLRWEEQSFKPGILIHPSGMVEEVKDARPGATP